MNRGQWTTRIRIGAVGALGAGVLGLGAWAVLPAARAATDDDSWSTQWLSTYGAEHDSHNRVITLTEPITAATTLRIPDGYTLDGAGQTITLADDADLDSSDAVLTAEVDAREIHIENLTIDGSHAYTGAFFFGIRLSGVTGSISDTTVRDIRHATDAGSQAGVGVRVDNPEGGKKLAFDIDALTVQDYQKGGIVADGDLDLTIRNSVVGKGHSSAVAANSIQVSRGSHALLEKNEVAGNRYDNPAETYGTGVLMYGEKSVELKNNTITGGDVGLSLADGLADMGDQNFRTDAVTLIGNTIEAPSTVPDSTGIRISSDTGELPDATFATMGNTITGYATAYIGQDLAPTAPTGMSARGDIALIDFSWTAPVNPLIPLTGYQIELTRADGKRSTIEVDSTKPSFMAKALEPGTYSARIRATDEVGAGSWSQPVTDIEVTDQLGLTAPNDDGDKDGKNNGNGTNGGGSTHADPLGRADTGL